MAAKTISSKSKIIPYYYAGGLSSPSKLGQVSKTQVQIVAKIGGGGGGARPTSGQMFPRGV